MFALRSLSALLLALLFALPVTVDACPLCKEAISTPDGSSGEEEETLRLPMAYNRSIYLMIGVPYFLLGSVGFLIYRGCKKNAEFRRLLEEQRGEHS